MIVIMGASGRVGGALLNFLTARGVAVRAVSRRPPRDAVGGRVEWRSADALDAAALEHAFAGAQAAFVLNPIAPDADDVHAQADRVSASVARALQRARVPHAVALSSQGAHLPAGTGIVAALHRFERRLRDSGVPTTFLRPAYFLDNWVPAALEAAGSGRLPALLHPAGRTVEAVAAADAGERAGIELLQPAPRIVDLAGPRRYGDADAAAAVSRILGRGVALEPVPADRVEAVHRAAGMGGSFAREIAGLYAALNTDRIPFEAGGPTPLRGRTGLEDVLRPALEAAGPSR
jgi:uncharacterized protein YbjT (DUF2867 family)